MSSQLQNLDGVDSGSLDPHERREDQDQDPTRLLPPIRRGELPPSEEEVRSHLRGILESREFRSSKRSQQFLQHVVDCALRGEIQRLKESSIGLDLFGRAPGYDTSADSSVRVRASDVRRRLDTYYQTVGSGTRVRIELPSGSYVPRFCHLKSIPAALPSNAGTGSQIAAHPFPAMRDTRLRHLQRVAADLRAGARCEFDSEALGAQSQTQCAPNLGRATQTTELKAADPDFLYPLMASFAEAMAADCVYIGTLTTEDAGTVKTVVVVTGGQIIENFEYALAGSPCENVVGKTALIRPKGVRREFPNNPVLQLMDVESYVGAPLFDCRGGSLGLLVVLSRQPLLDTQLAKSLLDVYAVRIAAELERKIAEHALYESDQRYRALLESAADAILMMRGERFVDCNPSALQLFGCTREQLLGQTLLAFSQSVQHDLRDPRELATENIGRALRGETSLFHWRAHRLDASVFDAQITLRRVDGLEPPLLLAHVRNVTDT